jgi:hypothetical protein
MMMSGEQPTDPNDAKKLHEIFFNADLTLMVNIPVQNTKDTLYSVIFGYYLGYFLFSERPIEEFHAALVEGRMQEYLMNAYDDISPGSRYLMFVKQNELDFNQIAKGDLVQ